MITTIEKLGDTNFVMLTTSIVYDILKENKIDTKIPQFYRKVLMDYSSIQVRDCLESIIKQYGSLENFEYCQNNFLSKGRIPDMLVEGYSEAITKFVSNTLMKEYIQNLVSKIILSFFNKVSFLKYYEEVQKLLMDNAIDISDANIDTNVFNKFNLSERYFNLAEEDKEKASVEIKKLNKLLEENKFENNEELFNNYLGCIIFKYIWKYNKSINASTGRKTYEKFKDDIDLEINKIITENISFIQELKGNISSAYFIPRPKLDSDDAIVFLSVVLSEFGTHNQGCWSFKQMYNKLGGNYTGKDIRVELFRYMSETEPEDVVNFSFAIADSFIDNYGSDNELYERIADIKKIYTGKIFNGKLKIKDDKDIQNLVLYSFIYSYGKDYPIFGGDRNGEILGSATPISIDESINDVNHFKGFLDLESMQIENILLVDVFNSGLYMRVEDNRVYLICKSDLFNSYLEVFSFDLKVDNMRSLLGVEEKLSALFDDNVDYLEVFSYFDLKVKKNSILQFVSGWIDTINNFGKPAYYDFDENGSDIKKYMFNDLNKFKIFEKHQVKHEDFSRYCAQCVKDTVSTNFTDLYILVESFNGKKFLFNLLTAAYSEVTCALYYKKLQEKGIYELERREVHDGIDSIEGIEYYELKPSEYTVKLENILNKDRKFEQPRIDKFIEAPILLIDLNIKKMFSYLIILIKLGYMGSECIKLSDDFSSADYVTRLEELSQELDEDLSYDDTVFLKKVLSSISFNFNFIFDNIKMCNCMVKDLDLKDYLGYFIERIGESLTIYNFRSLDEELRISNVFYMDYIENFNFEFTEYGLLEKNVYSALSDDLARCGKVGKDLSVSQLSEVSEYIFAYVFYSIIILERQRIQEYAENVKNRKVNVDVLEEDLEQELEQKENEYREKESLTREKRPVKVSDKEEKPREIEQVKIRKNSLTEEELDVINSIDTGVMDNILSSENLVGVKVLSLNSLFVKNISRVFKGNKSLERVKPTYSVKSWPVRGYTRVSKNGKITYVEPGRRHRSKELLGKDTVEYQQKVLTEGSLLKNIETLDETNLFK